MQNEIRHKNHNLTQLQNESISNMLPAATLLQDRNQEILALERELKVLEGDDGDEDEDTEDSVLDSSQTHGLGSASK